MPPPRGDSKHRLWLSAAIGIFCGQKPEPTCGGKRMSNKPKRRKPIPITFRVTERDAETIRKKAKSAEMDLTKYLTTCAVGKEIKRIDGINDFISELRQQGTNLNQLTTLSNMGRISAVNLSETYGLYLEIQKILKEILEKKV